MKLSLLLLFLLPFTPQKEVSGVLYSKIIKKEGIELKLNGAGVKSNWFVDLYTAGLYLTKKSNNPDSIINCDCPTGLRIVIVSSVVTASFFKSAVDSWFLESENGNVDHIKDRIELFKDAFGSSISKNDDVVMIYKPNRGINIYKNGTFVQLIPGLDFKKSLAKLWLGDNPRSAQLKSDLLGY